MKTGVLFSAEELKGLVKVSSSCVRVERRVRHIALLPNCLADLKSAVNGILNSYQNRFDMNFKGFILGYKNVKILTDKATIINDDVYMHFDIEAEFYIFTPEEGCILFGTVNKKSVDHIGCLVHKFFHVSIPRLVEDTDEKWPGTSVDIGDEVTFAIKVCDFTGSLPYIQGKLLNSSPASKTSLKEDEVNSISEPRKKKKKKHNRLSEGAKCDLMDDSLEKEKKDSESQHRKRKRHSDDETAAAEKKKKMKKLEGCETVCNETPEGEGLQVTRLSSEDVEYDSILENLKETYLNRTLDLDSSHKKKKKKKHKSHRDRDENRETVTEMAKDLEHSHKCNGDEFSDLAKKINKGEKGKKEDIKNHKENEEVEIESIKTKIRHMEKKSKIKDSKGRKHKEKKVKKENAKDHKESKEAKIESSETKKRHKEKKSKTKDNKDKEHKEKKGKMENAKDHRENEETKIESSKTKKRHIEKESRISDKGGEEGKQQKSKGYDTEDNLKDLKTLASKLFNNFLQ